MVKTAGLNQREEAPRTRDRNMAKILIVEDDPITAATIQTLLQSASHECVVLENGKNVIDIAKSYKPDLLLLDVMLPGSICGFEICRQIRRDPELYILPILIVSAMSHDEEIAHGLSQGADDYLPKPFDSHVLLRRIDALLEIHTSSDGQDTLTGLPAADIIRHEIQRRISMRQPFAIVCAELSGLRELGRTYGAEARTRVIKQFAKLLEKCGKKLSETSFFLGHMGGGYFVCLLDIDKTVAFCKYVQKFWEEHSKRLFGTQDFPGEIIKSQQNPAFVAPKVLLCATACECKPCDNPKELFDVLAQLRGKGLGGSSGGIFLDQRCKHF